MFVSRAPEEHAFAKSLVEASSRGDEELLASLLARETGAAQMFFF